MRNMQKINIVELIFLNDILEYDSSKRFAFQTSIGSKDKGKDKELVPS